MPRADDGQVAGKATERTGRKWYMRARIDIKRIPQLKLNMEIIPSLRAGKIASANSENKFRSRLKEVGIYKNPISEADRRKRGVKKMLDIKESRK